MKGWPDPSRRPRAAPPPPAVIRQPPSRAGSSKISSPLIATWARNSAACTGPHAPSRPSASRADQAHSFGKAAAVGENGELEHAAAILHPKLGAPVRRALGKGAALIPSSKKRGAVGVSFDIPLGHKDAAFVRSHYDGMTVSVSDAPRPNEIVIAVAVTDSGRPLPRVGGLTAAEAIGEDGLR